MVFPYIVDSENGENDDVEIISTHDEKVKIIGEILSNDSSRKILNLLNSSNEMTINEIAQKTGLSLSLVTHHLKRMQSAQVVKVSKVGRSVKGHKMNYYSATNQSFLIVPSKEPVHSITSSLKKFSKFFAIGMAGFFSWMTLKPNSEFSEQVSPGTPQLNLKDESENKGESAYQTRSDEDQEELIVDSFTSDEEYEDASAEQESETVSSEPVHVPGNEPIPEPEPEPSHSGIEEFNFSEDSTSLGDTVRENTGSISLDSEVYPVPYSSEPSYAIDIDGVFLSIVIPIIVVISGIILERILTRWYNKRKLKN
ncbi:MAG: winged helix-turn-helix domain-containing protein [Nitrosopumilus sp.]|nr:winged helix-turn-helix domain-containing protein [Nitrosopumilus sp.]